MYLNTIDSCLATHNNGKSLEGKVVVEENRDAEHMRMNLGSRGTANGLASSEIVANVSNCLATFASRSGTLSNRLAI